MVSLRCYWEGWKGWHELSYPREYQRCFYGDLSTCGWAGEARTERSLVFRSVAVNEQYRPDVADSCGVTEASELWCFRLDASAPGTASWTHIEPRSGPATPGEAPPPWVEVDVAADTACALDGSDKLYCFSARTPGALSGELEQSFERNGMGSGGAPGLTEGGYWMQLVEARRLKLTTPYQTPRTPDAWRAVPHGPELSIFHKLGQPEAYPGPALIVPTDKPPPAPETPETTPPETTPTNEPETPEDPPV